jgi:hypothetical protein
MTDGEKIFEPYSKEVVPPVALNEIVLIRIVAPSPLIRKKRIAVCITLQLLKIADRDHWIKKKALKEGEMDVSAE